MARKAKEQAPPVRKGLLITGGVAIGAVLVGFVVMNFVLGGGAGGESDVPPATTAAPGAPVATPAPTPEPSEPAGLTPGGRNPFAAGTGVQAAAAPEAEVESASVTNETIEISVLKVYDRTADLRFGDFTVEGAKEDQVLSPRFNLDNITEDCVYMKDDGERFKLCAGESVTR